MIGKKLLLREITEQQQSTTTTIRTPTSGATKAVIMLGTVYLGPKPLAPLFVVMLEPKIQPCQMLQESLNPETLKS